jgi:hypothetical protein
MMVPPQDALGLGSASPPMAVRSIPSPTMMPQDALLDEWIAQLANKCFTPQEVESIGRRVATAERHQGVVPVMAQLAIILPEQPLAAAQRLTFMRDLDMGLSAGPAKQLAMLAVASNFEPGGTLVPDRVERIRALHPMNEAQALACLGVAQEFNLETMPATIRIHVMRSVLHLPQDQWQEVAAIMAQDNFERPPVALALLLITMCHDPQKMPSMALWRHMAALHGSEQHWAWLQACLTPLEPAAAMLVLRITELLCRRRGSFLSAATLSLAESLGVRSVRHLEQVYQNAILYNVQYPARPYVPATGLDSALAMRPQADGAPASSSDASSMLASIDIRKYVLEEHRNREINTTLRRLWHTWPACRPDPGGSYAVPLQQILTFCADTKTTHPSADKAAETLLALQNALENSNGVTARFTQQLSEVLLTVWRILEGSGNAAEQDSRIKSLVAKDSLLYFLALINRTDNFIEQETLHLALLLIPLMHYDVALPALILPMASEWADTVYLQLLKTYHGITLSQQSLQRCMKPWLDMTRLIYGSDRPETVWVISQLSFFRDQMSQQATMH